MTAHRDLKNIIRERHKKTGESYTAARVHVMRERAELLDLPAEEAPPPQPATQADAVVLKVNRQSARVRILGEDGQATFCSSGVWNTVPGHVVTLVIERRWTWRGDAYARVLVREARTALRLSTVVAGTAGPGPLSRTGQPVDRCSAEEHPRMCAERRQSGSSR